MSKKLEVDDFVFCEVRWPDVDGTNHQCAEHQPGHEVHACCCGAKQ